MSTMPSRSGRHLAPLIFAPPACRMRSGAGAVALALALLAAGCGGGGGNNNTGGTGGSGATGGTGGGGAGGTGGGSAMVSYSNNVRPIFVSACVDCHSPGGATGYDLASPFDPKNGIINRPNSWNAAGTGSKETKVVDPGNVDNSFLIRKVTDPNLDVHIDGSTMPYNPDPLTQAQIDAITQWIQDGARNDAFFAANVAPVLGTEAVLGSRAGHCAYCHYRNAPSGMSVVEPFDSTVGMVNRMGRYPMKIVAPGDPNNSTLIKKLTTTTLGNQMPLRKARLTAEQVETLRKWVTAGAPNN